MAHILCRLELIITHEKAIHVMFFYVVVVLSCKRKTEKQKQSKNRNKYKKPRSISFHRWRRYLKRRPSARPFLSMADRCSFERERRQRMMPNTNISL